MAKTAVITGITGQDGSYLADILVQKGYRVVGLTRAPEAKFTKNIRHLEGKIELLFTPYDVHSLTKVLTRCEPDELYNFAGQSYVSKSWEMVQETLHSTGLIPTYFLEAIVNVNSKIKFLQASSSEIFFPLDASPLTEESPISPGNPYGCSKALAYHMVRAYRKNYDLFAANAILFGHESPRRHENFLSKKLVRGAVKIKLGLADHLALGSLAVARDWGYAPDYMEAVHRLMQLPQPDDVILSCGKPRTVEDMVRIVFGYLGLDHRSHVRQDQRFYRSFEPEAVCGSNAKARRLLAWEPRTSFEDMLKIMVDDEMKEQRIHGAAV